MKARLSKWFDECKMAALGVVLASRNSVFVRFFIVFFLLFGILISLLSSGNSGLDLFFAADFPGKLKILGDSFLVFFGKGRNFLDFLINFLLAFFQALLIGLIAFVYSKRKRNQKKAQAVSAQAQAESTLTTSGIQNASIATGLALLGSGCPTCGTTLITPLLVAIFSSGSYALASAISGVLTTIAYLLILWSLKKMGLEAYVIIKDEEWRKKHATKRNVNG